MNIMRKIKIEKITLNCGTADKAKLAKSIKLLETISERKAVKTFAKRRIPEFGITPGLAVGCKVTLRGKSGVGLLKRILEGIDNKLSKKQFNPDSFSFGIKEYIQIPTFTYLRDVGIIGFEVTVTLTRAGYNVKERKIKKGKIPKRHRITVQETIDFAKENLNIEVI
jgi:large subunit ribosomal protein L5